MDTLTFQNRTLKDKAKRFEEALRKNTDEQIVVCFFKTIINGYLNIGTQTLKVSFVNVFAGCAGTISAYRGGLEESEGGSGDEEPANS